jgi:hypothetical protein
MVQFFTSFSNREERFRSKSLFAREVNMCFLWILCFLRKQICASMKSRYVLLRKHIFVPFREAQPCFSQKQICVSCGSIFFFLRSTTNLCLHEKQIRASRESTFFFFSEKHNKISMQRKSMIFFSKSEQKPKNPI